MTKRLKFAAQVGLALIVFSSVGAMLLPALIIVPAHLWRWAAIPRPCCRCHSLLEILAEPQAERFVYITAQGCTAAPSVQGGRPR